MPTIETPFGTQKNERAYFAASNSYKGFISYFNEIFRSSQISHLYIIKGGPGTGKSRFIREIASDAEALGYDTEYYYCSSDQSSLDGLIISVTKGDGYIEQTAFVDGTSPHAFDTSIPGVFDDIINLGQFWDISTLRDHENEIRSLTLAKSRCFEKAYRYLSFSHSVKKMIEDTVFIHTDRKKIEEYANDVALQVKASKGIVRPALIDSFGALGEIRYDSFSPFSKKTIFINDYLDTADILMKKIFDLTKGKGADIYVSYSPTEPGTISALYFNNGELSVIKNDNDYGDDVGRKDSEIHNMRSYTDLYGMKDEKVKISRLLETRRTFNAMAMNEFEKAGKVHYEIESIYSYSMDFAKKELFSSEFRKNLFSV